MEILDIRDSNGRIPKLSKFCELGKIPPYNYDQ